MILNGKLPERTKLLHPIMRTSFMRKRNMNYDFRYMLKVRYLGKNLHILYLFGYTRDLCVA